MPAWTGALTVAALVVAGVAVARPVAMRGVIEGYYGRPWTGDARRDVIAFLGARGLNTFVYAPKNDPFHRQRWREPYPDLALGDMRASVEAARTAGVRFVYALSPALDVCYSCAADFDALTDKLAQVATTGVRQFALLFDDAPETLQHAADVARYGGSDAPALGRAHADLTRRAAAWIRARHLGRLVFIVPTDYAGTACSPYHTELARHLPRGLPVGWTGSGVFAPVITAAEARARAACLRRPVILWDNVPVNDTVLANNLHLGPLTGRDPELPRALRGYLLNPMTQAHASLVTIGTAAAYLRDPRRYDPEAAWRETLAKLGGPSLQVLAENTRSSALDLDDARPLAAALDAVARTYPGPDWSPAVDALEAEESRQGAAATDLTLSLGALPLGGEIMPWVRELASHASRGAQAAALLRRLKPALDGVLATVEAGTLRVSGRAFPPDSAAAALLGPGFAAEARAVQAEIEAPPIAPYLACLGDVLGPDLRLCPELGLNVHGKRLFFFIRSTSEVRIVTDRNVHDRLVLFVARTYAEFAARWAPGPPVLGLTIDGLPVGLAEDGSFSALVPLPPSGRARLLLVTSAGEATALEVP